MNIEDLKHHLRIDHSFDDALIEEYKEWAIEEVKDSVSTSKNRNEEYFEGNAHFTRAVTMLTAHFYENRLPMSPINQHYVSEGVTSAIHKLRGGYYELD